MDVKSYIMNGCDYCCNVTTNGCDNLIVRLESSVGSDLDIY